MDRNNPYEIEVEVDAEFISIFDDNTSAIIEGQQNGFLMTLTTLSAYIIVADGIVTKGEKDFVTNFFLDTFGYEDGGEYLKVLAKLIKRWKKIPKKKLTDEMKKQCNQMLAIMTLEDIQLLVSYLQKLADADDVYAGEEDSAIKNVCQWLCCPPENP